MATLSTSGRVALAERRRARGGAAGGGVTPLGTTATRPAGSRSSRSMSAAEACETVMTRSARRAAAGDEHVRAEPHRGRHRVGQPPPQHVVDGQHARAPPPCSGPKFATECRTSSPRAAPRQLPQLAQRPRAAADAGGADLDHVAPPRSRTRAGRRRLAVDERGQLEVGPLRREPAHELARVGLAPAGLARDEEQQVEADPHGSAAAHEPPVGGLGGGERAQLGGAGRGTGESSQAVSAPANSLALTVAAACTAAAAAQHAPAARAAPRPARAASPPASRRARRRRRSASSASSSAGSSAASSGRG